MKAIILELEKISHAAKTGDAKHIKSSIENARTAISKEPTQSTGLMELDGELSVWSNKIEVLSREPIARQGMVKHIHHWVERLKK